MNSLLIPFLMAGMGLLANGRLMQRLSIKIGN